MERLYDQKDTHVLLELSDGVHKDKAILIDGQSYILDYVQTIMDYCPQCTTVRDKLNLRKRQIRVYFYNQHRARTYIYTCCGLIMSE